MGFLDLKLNGKKTAAQLSAAIPTIEAQIATANETLTELRAAIRSAAFDRSAQELVALRNTIRETEEDLETLHGILEEAHQRRELAAAAEDLAGLEQEVRDLRKVRDTMPRAWAKYDTLLGQLTELVDELATDCDRLRQVNVRAIDLRRDDLRLRYSDLNGMSLLRVREALGALSGASQSKTYATMKSEGRL